MACADAWRELQTSFDAACWRRGPWVVLARGTPNARTRRWVLRWRMQMEEICAGATQSSLEQTQI